MSLFLKGVLYTIFHLLKLETWVLGKDELDLDQIQDSEASPLIQWQIIQF